jgi:hypothetical protein
MTQWATVVLLAITALVSGCSFGSGTEVEGMQCAVQGQVIDSSGASVSGAIVRVRPHGFLALNGKEFFTADTITDKQGGFRFDTMPADSYTVEINKNGKLAALQQFCINADDSLPLELPTVGLTPTGSIQGRINLPVSDDTSRPWIALYNVDYLTKTPFTQNFCLDGVPCGVYRLRIVPYFDSKLVMELRDVVVKSGEVNDVGTLNFAVQQFFKGCVSGTCDSIAVRMLLDANSLMSIDITDVATRDADGRVIELDLSGRGLTILPKEIGSLSMLRKLDISRNSVHKFPGDIGYLRNLTTLHGDSNNLYMLPDEMRFIDSLSVITLRGNQLTEFNSLLAGLRITTIDLGKNRLTMLPDVNNFFPVVRCLYLDNNELASLPPALTNLSPDTLTVYNNRLCDIPEPVTPWLDRHSPGWKASQTCE